MRARGFSMIELVVVLSIIMILAALTVPNYFRFASVKKLDTSAREVETALRAARGRAVTGGENYKVVFTLGSDTYLIEDAGGALVDKAYTLQAPVSVNWTDFTGHVVEFEPDGSGVWGADTREIVLQDRTGNQRRLTVVGTTGRVRRE